MARLRFSLLLIASVAFAGPARLRAAMPEGFEKEVRPLLKELCAGCHNAEKQKGDFDLEPLLAKPDFPAQREAWEKTAEMLASHEMPPEKKPQPSDKHREMLAQFIERELGKADSAAPANPGKVTIRRLNKDEYRRTVSELLRVDFQPVDFPNDEVGYGFNNIADVLSLSPVLLEKYLVAAETIAKKALLADATKTMMWKLRGDQFSSDKEWVRAREDKVLELSREGEGAATIELPTAGEYTLRVRAFGEQAGPEAPRLSVKLGGKDVGVFEVKNERSKTFEARVTAAAGALSVSVGYLNNYRDTTNPDPKLRGDRNLFVESIELEGPHGAATPLSESQKLVLNRLPNAGDELAIARESLARFAKRAYRRPVSDAEVARLTSFVELALAHGGSFLEGMQAAVQAALCSPHFLFRWELDSGAAKPDGVRELNGFEVASRLSYFLWSSMPDDELFALAESGELLKDGNIEKQVKRMLVDGRARALVENFGGQWLQVHNMEEVDPDPATFPSFNGELRDDMRRETFSFLDAIVKEDRSVFDLIDSDYTFLNERLAKHYGIAGVSGGEFRRVVLEPGSPRGGVLAQGSVLLATSMPTRTSPVIRGKWILEQILGTPPPPPPANVPPLDAQTGVDLNAPLRQRLEQHRENPDCAGCHAKMDPLGFALENFDALGAWRTTDGKNAIDTSAKLPNGTEITGPADLKKVLKSDKFVRALAEKMTIYALGRGLERYDKRSVDTIAAKTKAGDYRFSALVTAVVTSEPFLKRKGGAKLASQ